MLVVLACLDVYRNLIKRAGMGCLVHLERYVIVANFGVKGLRKIVLNWLYDMRLRIGRR